MLDHARCGPKVSPHVPRARVLFALYANRVSAVCSVKVSTSASWSFLVFQVESVTKVSRVTAVGPDRRTGWRQGVFTRLSRLWPISGLSEPRDNFLRYLFFLTARVPRGLTPGLGELHRQWWPEIHMLFHVAQKHFVYGKSTAVV